MMFLGCNIGRICFGSISVFELYLCSYRIVIARTSRLKISDNLLIFSGLPDKSTVFAV